MVKYRSWHVWDGGDDVGMLEESNGAHGLNEASAWSGLCNWDNALGGKRVSDLDAGVNNKVSVGEKALEGGAVGKESVAGSKEQPMTVLVS